MGALQTVTMRWCYKRLYFMPGEVGHERKVQRMEVPGVTLAMVASKGMNEKFSAWKAFRNTSGQVGGAGRAAVKGHRCSRADVSVRVPGYGWSRTLVR